jgi:hypothetical protein
MSIGYPTSASNPPAAGVVVTGSLPRNEVDVDLDPNKTFILCPDCDNGNPSKTSALIAYPDGLGGYYVFFNPVVNGSGKTVTIQITYLDQGLEDVVQNVVLS